MGQTLRRLAQVTAWVAVGAVLAGCTGEPSTPPVSTTTQQSAEPATSGSSTASTGPGSDADHSTAKTVTLGSMAGSASASPAVAPTHRQLALTCSDGGLGLHFPKLDKSGVTLEGIAGPGAGQGTGTDFRLTAPYQDFAFRKAPLYLSGDTRSVTISVPADGRQFLGWVPTAVWTTSDPQPDLRPWITPTVTLQACTGGVTGFLGGIFAEDPTHCFPMMIKINDRPETTKPLRLDGVAC